MIFRVFATLSVTAGLLAGTPVYAADDEPGGSAQTCKRGFVFDRRKKKCIRQSSQVLPDKELTSQAWQLARDGRYHQAIETFELVSLKDRPKVLNGLGYAYRKLGKIDIGVTYYRRALVIDPDYVLARSYLGEGYVALGRMDLAMQQLREIENRCGSECRAYRLLAQTISGA